jgi:hypothetical protein
LAAERPAIAGGDDAIRVTVERDRKHRDDR